jgi:8-oxo-dGTP diphosphatase
MRVVAVGVLRRKGNVLICQRRREAVYPLKWEFPGGKLEPGERPEEALRRELHEELAVEATIGAEFHRQEWVYPEGVVNPGRDGSFRVYYFLVEGFRGEPENRVFEQIRWLSPAELPEMDILDGNHDAVRILIDREARASAAQS